MAFNDELIPFGYKMRQIPLLQMHGSTPYYIFILISHLIYTVVMKSLNPDRIYPACVTHGIMVDGYTDLDLICLEFLDAVGNHVSLLNRKAENFGYPHLDFML